MQKPTVDDMLLVVDMQHDFISGVLGSPEAQAIVPRVANLVELFDKTPARILFTKDSHVRTTYESSIEGQRIPMHCLASSEGAGIDDRIIAALTGNPAIVYKSSFGRLWDERDFAGRPDPIRLFVCGLCTDICVVSNALILRALLPCTSIFCVEDCCAGTSKEAHDAALTVMKSCLINMTTLEELEHGA